MCPHGFEFVRICRPGYGCRACGAIHQAPAQERTIAKGLASPAVLAHVLIAKYCNHLPLYRQSRIFARQGRRDRPLDPGELGGQRLLARAAAPASPPMCLDQPSRLPTTRRSRCSIPAAAAPRPAGCGSMRARRSTQARTVGRRLLLQSGSQGRASCRSSPELPWCAASRRLLAVSSPSARRSCPALLGRPNRCSINSAIIFVICASGLSQ